MLTFFIGAVEWQSRKMCRAHQLYNSVHTLNTQTKLTIRMVKSTKVAKSSFELKKKVTLDHLPYSESRSWPCWWYFDWFLVGLGAADDTVSITSMEPISGPILFTKSSMTAHDVRTSCLPWTAKNLRGKSEAFGRRLSHVPMVVVTPPKIALSCSHLPLT